MTVPVLDLLRRMLGLGTEDGVERQFGAMPWRSTDEGLDFLLVTSRQTGRWIFPKGGRIALLSGAACAAQEAYEEAGVEGTVAERPIGRYRGTKLRGAETTPIEVEVYPLEVELELEDWPERGERRRRWATADEACDLVSDPGIVALMREFAAARSGRSRAPDEGPPGPSA